MILVTIESTYATSY